MWAITKSQSMFEKILITWFLASTFMSKIEMWTLNHISFGGTCRKPEIENVVVPTMGIYCFFSISFFPPASFPTVIE